MKPKKTVKKPKATIKRSTKAKNKTDKSTKTWHGSYDGRDTIDSHSGFSYDPHGLHC